MFTRVPLRRRQSRAGLTARRLGVRTHDRAIFNMLLQQAGDDQLSAKGGASARQPLISVIMPAFNSASTIVEAIRSVQAQTLTDLELLVIDDGSSDATSELVAALCAQDSRIVLHTLSTNLGVSQARNFALAVARGKWIALVDSDDLIVPERFERLISMAESRRSDFIADNLFFLDEGSRLHEVAFPANLLAESSPLTPIMMIERDKPRVTTVSFGFLKPMMRRSFLTEHRLQYDAELKVSEDFNLYLRAVALGAVFHCVNWAGYGYNRRDGSLTRTREAGLMNLQMAIRSSDRLVSWAENSGRRDLVPALHAHGVHLRVVHWIDSAKLVFGRNGWKNRARVLLSMPPHPILIGIVVWRRLILGRRQNPMENRGRVDGP